MEQLGNNPAKRVQQILTAYFGAYPGYFGVVFFLNVVQHAFVIFTLTDCRVQETCSKIYLIDLDLCSFIYIFHRIFT